jgi:hypothetical protein
MRYRILPVAALGIACLVGTLLPARGSSHREAPLITEDPVADNTDFYAFVSHDKPDTVTIISNWIPLEEPAGGPNFHRFGDDVLYTINIDNNGDAEDDIVYEFRFTTQVMNGDTFLYNTDAVTSLADPDLNVRQTYSVARVRGGERQILASDLPTPPVNIGPRSTPDYPSLAAQAVRSLPDGSKVFAGQRDDAFFVDLGSVFDLAGLRLLNPAHKQPLVPEPGLDGVGGYNTHTIALQVPKNLLTHDGSPGTDRTNPNSIIGLYSASLRRSQRVLSTEGEQPRTSGDWVQVSRLGMPLVNEVLIPLGKKDRWNASQPRDDAQFFNYFQDPEVARLVPVLYPLVSVPPAPRDDIVAVFLTGIQGLNQPPNVKPADLLRLNMAIPPSPIVSPLGLLPPLPIDTAVGLLPPLPIGNPLGLLTGQEDGFPNGRRLADDVTDIELRVLAGGTPFTPAFNRPPNNLVTDGIEANDQPFLSSFPYIGVPWQGYRHEHHRIGP